MYVCALAFAARILWELGGLAFERLYAEWEPMGRPPVLSGALVLLVLIGTVNLCARRITRRAFGN